jgi:esterase/lipase/1-acyl-sn-glycerol-3-phosphate acyltransferase
MPEPGGRSRARDGRDATEPPPAPGAPPTTRPLHPQAPGTVVRRATGLALGMIERALRASIRLEGVENCGRGPVLFVANHFTRFETFILPYVIDRATGRNVHSLAHHSLFRGRFGDYLRTVGALSTRDPGIKERAVAELLSGSHDWLIYPEGGMVKDKHTWERGRFTMHTPDHHGPPHTGAAVMALQAGVWGGIYRAAAAAGDHARCAAISGKFGLHGPVPAIPLTVVPVTITYYPLRPRPGLVYRLAQFFLRDMSGRMEDELLIEGGLLFGDTDITISFGAPIALERWQALLAPAMTALPGADDDKVQAIVDALRGRLTNRFMAAVYRGLTINLDHLFCAGMRLVARGRIHRDAFHAALWLAARALRAQGRHRLHPGIRNAPAGLIDDLAWAPLADVRALASGEGVLSEEGAVDCIDHDAMDRDLGFQAMRVRNPVAVIANELEPLRDVIHLLKTLVNLPRHELRARVAAQLRTDDLAVYAREYSQSEAQEGDATRRQEPALGRPCLLDGDDGDAMGGKSELLHAHPAPTHGADHAHVRPRKTGEPPLGLVLAHGYLGCPGELHGLASYLQERMDLPIYLARLGGHGTAPGQLARAAWEDWLDGVERACALMRARAGRVVVGGFSTGGLLALMAAAARGHALAGVFAMNPPVRLMDGKARMAGAVDTWNQMAAAVGVPGRYEYVTNHPEFPRINYHLNPVHAIHELTRLLSIAPAQMPRVVAPTLIIQGDHDPVVNAAAATDLLHHIGAAEKTLVPMAFKRHGIVQGEGAPVVWRRVGEFVANLAERQTHQHPESRVALRA